jgi:endonuclease-3
MPAMKPKPETQPELQARTKQLIHLLKQEYKDPKCALNHTNAFELLIATILSAQCTDERVNLVTAELFRKYRQPADYLNVPLSELEQDLSSINFYRNKAKNIQGACQVLLERHHGIVPQTMEALRALPGVGRKTANVVLGNAFGIASGIVVDTHVARLSQRLGLTAEQTAEKIEAALIPLVPEKEWINFSHRLIWHGRKVCKARTPLCEQCRLAPLCPSAKVG